MKDMFTATPAELRSSSASPSGLSPFTVNTAIPTSMRWISKMDLEACHCNGCPLRLADMEQADAFNLMHDVTGINMHLNRNTGELSKRFLPRFFDASKEGRRHE